VNPSLNRATSSLPPYDDEAARKAFSDGCGPVRVLKEEARSSYSIEDMVAHQASFYGDVVSVTHEDFQRQASLQQD
jgi:hypothetical protein